MNNIKISFLKNSSYIIEDSRKSKGKTSLITKIKSFFKYIKNVYIFKTNSSLEKLNDKNLDEFIEFLNNEKITLEKAVQEINDNYDKLEENLEPNGFEAIKLATETQSNLDELRTQNEKIDAKIADAESEKQAREEQEEMETTIDEEIPEVEQEETYEPISEIEEQLPEVEIPVEEEIQPIDYAQDVQIAQENNEQPEVQIENLAKEEPVDVMAKIQEEYKNNIDAIQQKYIDNFGKDFAEIINKIMIETEKYAGKQVEEITNISKEAINIANNNTQRTIDEKKAIESDRDQYKSHYEQSLATIEEKNKTIDSKDEEIKLLKEEIEKQKQELATRDNTINNLNDTINQKDSSINELEKENNNYKVTVATLMRDAARGTGALDEEISKIR